MAYISRRGVLAGASALGFAGGTGMLAALAPTAAAADTSGYKALVCVFLKGGLDGADTVLPLDAASHDALREARGDLFGAYGVGSGSSSRDRERAIIAWLDHCWRADAEAFYLVGDLFEFWFEWRHVVPRGYVRFLGKLAELVDDGIAVHIFTGNHDLWMSDYLSHEVGATIHRRPQRLRLEGWEVMVGHGDGLGPGDRGYKLMKKVFVAGWARWLYARLHPNFAVWLARLFSQRSREAQPAEAAFLGPEREWLVAYAERKLKQDPTLEVFIFGHRHLNIDHTLSNGQSRYINLGEWLYGQSYCRIDESSVKVLSWTGKSEQNSDYLEGKPPGVKSV